VYLSEVARETVLQMIVLGTRVVGKRAVGEGWCKFFQSYVGGGEEVVGLEGIVLCLGTVCADVSGHLCWQVERKEEGRLGVVVKGRLHVETWRSGLRMWQLVRDDVYGAETELPYGKKTKELPENPAAIKLQLTTTVLVEVVKNALAPGSLASRRCSNLWRNRRDSTKRDIRRGCFRLIGDDKAA
jgi:hypothetical protein